MTRSTLLTFILAFGLGMLAAGCTASSQLGDDNEGQQESRRDTVAAQPAEKPSLPPVQTKKQGFTTKEDTIEVESAQKSHRPEPSAHAMQPTSSGSAGTFGVQIGAFTLEKHAKRAKAVCEKRFHTTVIIVFDESMKLYKVSAGAFPTQREAMRLAAAMKKKYPREYRTSWVIRRSE